MYFWHFHSGIFMHKCKCTYSSIWKMLYPGTCTQHHIQQPFENKPNLIFLTSIQELFGGLLREPVAPTEQVSMIVKSGLLSDHSALISASYRISQERNSCRDWGPFSCVNFDFIHTKHSLMCTHVFNGFSVCLFWLGLCCIISRLGKRKEW